MIRDEDILGGLDIFKSQLKLGTGLPTLDSMLDKGVEMKDAITFPAYVPGKHSFFMGTDLANGTDFSSIRFLNHELPKDNGIYILDYVDRITPPSQSSFDFSGQLEMIRVIMQDARDESQGLNFLFEHL